MNLASQLENIDDLPSVRNNPLIVEEKPLKRLNVDFLPYDFDRYFSEPTQIVDSLLDFQQRKLDLMNTILTEVFLSVNASILNVTSINLANLKLYVNLCSLGLFMPKLQEVYSGGNFLTFADRSGKYSNLCPLNQNITTLDISNSKNFASVPSTFFQDCKNINFVNMSNN